MLLAAVQYGFTFLLSVGLALYLTPFIRSGALSFGVLDRPDGVLKRHREPVPYLGGVAVYLAFLLTLSLVFTFSAALLGLLLGGTMLAMLGLFDDLRVIAPRLKLAGQLLAAWVLLRSHISIQVVSLPETVTVPLTVLWLVGITNAVNILDVADGLATGVAAIAAMGLFVVAMIGGDQVLAVTALALAGSLLGFWRYNRPPAQIFLGDTGSLFVGFMLAALALLGAYTRYNEAALLAPVCILALPILETTLVVIARLGGGRSPFRGSSDHMALRLGARGWSPRRVLLFAYGASLLATIAGIAMVLVDLGTALWIAGSVGALFAGLLLWLLLACPAPPAR
ncbi:MAG: undecaprenyl/decaprenyl-phosphate alpha-N-acetylglucosaminyl 1-phosphate transferase [Deltaproteobacteria bacterium]|nr:undecaprenyl/decaprenyl-phosphate alpha-N-acetylglucosaminyl 1-phosphate transferase [Deltaproteobacteria bacterium]